MTSSTPVRTSAFDCLVRGFYSLRANWQLVPLLWLQQVAMMVLVVASVVGFLVPFGFGFLSLETLESMDAAEMEAILEDLLTTPATLLVPLLTGTAVASVLGLLAVLVYAWFQGGLMATLLAGERQALPGEPRDWRLFRTFEWRSFAGWGGRLMWRYFWLIHLYLALVLVVSLLGFLLLTLAIYGGARWGEAAAFGIGCGGSLPLLFTVVVMGLWYMLAQADLPREGSTVRSASRRALEVLGQRPGAVLLLVAVFFAASLVVGFGVMPFSMLTAPLAEDNPLGYCFGQMAAYLVQTVVGGLLSVAYFGATVALVHGGLPPAAPPAPREDG